MIAPFCMSLPWEGVMTRRPFRKRVPSILVAAAALLAGATVAASADASSRAVAAADRVDVYTGELTAEQLQTLNEAGVDHADVLVARGSRNGTAKVEVTITGLQARDLAEQGVTLRLKRIDGQSAALRSSALQTGVFRPYSGAGNIREELLQIAEDNPRIAQAVTIGQSIQGKPITAVRVSKDVRRLKDRKRPAVVYQAAQHAREWITPEMVRRLLHHYVDNYGSDRELTRIVDTTDLWFIPVVNVDGYDYTFTEDNRLWRKNLRDNDGDGQITGQDGVDLNRNFPYKWGYDNEGSSDQPTDETYRGASPGSEPETQAQIRLFDRVRPEYAINWHSAAQLLLYGVGWQALTSSPDDLIHQAVVGDPDHPAVPGYIPQLGAQLYTTNGETDGHMEETFGTLTETPEMSTCESASASDPDDAYEPDDCGSGFEFPDDETLIAAEVQKNFPYAIAVAKSAHDPDHPVSPVGRTVPDFDVDEFSDSYGGRQKVASVIRRSLGGKRMHYRINGSRRVRTTRVREWRGGERYGDDGNHYFAEYRGKVKGQDAGDRVEVWFSAAKPRRGRMTSEPFTYRVRDARRADVLVLADEDYTGVNPTYPAGTSAPRYAQQYVDAIRANGIRSVVWDVDEDGVPHDLGVLGHFDAVVWYLGDNRLTQDAVDEPVDSVIGPLPDSQVADRAKDLVLSVRSYINEGGKLIHAGETTSYFGPLRGANGGGIYYGLKAHPDEPCFISTSFRDDCELLSDDFVQYYLGAYDRQDLGTPTAFLGTDNPFTGFRAALAGTPTNPLDEAGAFQVTSTVLPPDEFPQFRSRKAGDYEGVLGPFEPVEGDWYVAGSHQDGLYRRLTRTIDLTGVSAAQVPALEAQLTYSTEEGYDHVIVEARTAGGADWTTLADKNGGTSTAVPAECAAGFFVEMHPWLSHYLTVGNPCTSTGTSGSWNSFSGESGGWAPVAFDLSAYAGKVVEVSFAYVSDPFTGGTGLFIDDTKVTTSGGVLGAEGFETGLGPWTVAGAPAGSPGNASEFVRSEALIDSVASVVTRDSVLLGFGLEQVPSTAERNAAMGRALRYVLR